MAPIIETVDPKTSDSCALGDCAAFKAGNGRAEACWLCWLAMRPHGWHPGEPLGVHARVMKSTTLINSEEDPELQASPPNTPPLFNDVHAAAVVAAMKEQYGREDEVLPDQEDRGVAVLPLLRDEEGAGTNVEHGSPVVRPEDLRADTRRHVSRPRRRTAGTSGPLTEWDIDWRI